MRGAAQRLASAGVEGAARDARLLLALALEIKPVEVILRETDVADLSGLAGFEALVARRLAGEPVSRIRGWREFYGRTFQVTPAVLDPRPETELLVEEGLKRLPPGGRVLDLGVGSGCILLSVLAERADASGLGLDVSPAALDIARANAKSLGVGQRAELRLASFADPFEDSFDLVLSNPPYIGAGEMNDLAREVREHDPHIALSPGVDALGAYTAILPAVHGWLKPGGWLGFEVGAGQAADVAGLMTGAGLADVTRFDDLAGIARAVFGRRPGDAP